ncbi:gamma-glutamylcyclotransferase family protein [Zhenhengia yiwuensis]|uniref:Gamma-glutamylcyclotransferase n=1 Tax=Zhenhengia yiwuensis TaxID=2763666 RepID=A0A926IFZ4_9FIRM|nr:gamma-glutamylcyclotransferase family protein [Zhenhengia yiwuensis]MBC8581046.1 gamma-glutamylcyclotransferase [Zhenhengia yiwuensis]MBS5800166.1 gamma-glutamylcyclotransferase [Clostridiales bacterium]
MKKRRLYAAYGSNMNLEQMARRCPTAKVIKYGFIEGYKLIFRGAPNNAYATIEPTEVEDRYGATKVVVWEVQESDEQALDRYEGYPVFYRKEYMQVHTFEDEYIDDVMVYVMNEDLRKEVNLPSQQYYEIIRKGYGQNNLGVNLLTIAYSRTAKVVEARERDAKK